MDNKHLPATLIAVIEQGMTAFSNLLKGDGVKYHTVDLDCNRLLHPQASWEAGIPPLELKDFFDALPDNRVPCLYFFELIDTDAQLVLDSFRAFREVAGPRATCTLKKRPPLHSKILYVGKVKKDIGGRMVVHLGYYKVGATAGLQLACWANKLNLKLRLHIYSFEPDMQYFVSALELPLARQLTPLFGKH